MNCARVIVIHNQSILLMKRTKPNDLYYTLIGGGIEEGETADQAALREAYEETSITVKDPQLVFIEDAVTPYGAQYIFTATYVEGEARLRPDSIEAQLNAKGGNTFEPLWVPISKLAHIPFRSTVLQQELLAALRDGFPQKPKKFASK